MKNLIATDGSEFSLRAARKFAEWALFNETTEIKIVSVAETIDRGDVFGVSDEYLEIVRGAAESAAEAAVEEVKSELSELLGDSDVKIETLAVPGNPAKVILEEATSWGADLIVVGSQGRGFWGRLLLGSVSSALTRHAPCSVLVVRSKSM